MNATKLCSIDGCEKPTRSRGWCEKHYYRWRRHGSPETVKKIHNDNHRRFMSHIKDSSSKSICWEWASSKNPNGYGMFSVNGKYMLAHRYMWETQNGPTTSEKLVDHKCHNPGCVNPYHLRLATTSQNSMNRKGANADTISGVRNVYKEDKAWVAIITKDGRMHRLGRFSSIEDAALVAERERAKLFGEFAGRS